jgi:hypothetical protein
MNSSFLVVQSKHTVTNAEVSSKNKFARRRKRTRTTPLSSGIILMIEFIF